MVRRRDVVAFCLKKRPAPPGAKLISGALAALPYVRVAFQTVARRQAPHEGRVLRRGGAALAVVEGHDLHSALGPREQMQEARTVDAAADRRDDRVVRADAAVVLQGGVEAPLQGF